MGAKSSPEVVKVLEAAFPKFCNFIKENKKLIHLNMTSVGLPDKLMMELICFLKRSQSLHCVHLCGNILSEECVDLMNSKLKPTLVSNMLTDKEKEMRKQKLLARIQKGIKENYYEKYEKIYDSVKVKDAMLEWLSLQQEYQHTQNLPQQNDNFFMPLILSKQLGHAEMKNAKHWKISNECY